MFLPFRRIDVSTHYTVLDFMAVYIRSNRAYWEIVGWLCLALVISYMTIELLDWIGVLQTIFQRPLVP